MLNQRYELLLQRSCRPGLTPVNRIAAVSEWNSDRMAFLWNCDSLLIRMEKKIGKNPFPFAEHGREGVRSRMWPLVPLGWGSLRKEGLSSPDLTSCFVLSLPSAAGNRHPHAPEQIKQQDAYMGMAWPLLLWESTVWDTFISDASSSPCIICLGPAAMAVAGTTCEELWQERVGRHCLHRVRYHQNQHESVTLQFIAEWKWKLWALLLHQPLMPSI